MFDYLIGAIVGYAIAHIPQARLNSIWAKITAKL